MSYTTINEICNNVKYKDGNWFVFGGYNLFLHGIKYETKDIDIYCNDEAYNKFEKYFIKLGLKLKDKSSKDNSYKQFCIEDYLNFNFEVMCEVNGNYYKKYLNKENIEVINNIPCLKLKPQAIGYLEVKLDGKSSKNLNETLERIIKIYKFLNEI